MTFNGWDDPFLRIIPAFAAFAGFLIALYIRHHKNRPSEKFVCPIGSRCDQVIHSEFSRFFGIPVELLGLVYYLVIFTSSIIFLATSAMVHPLVTFALLGFTTAAFLFSLYLTFVQAFFLKRWCTWCLISAALCTIIFVTSLIGSRFTLQPILVEYHNFILLAHAIGIALGVGGATITDVFFFRFLKDFRISESESDVMRSLSDVIWFGLAIIVLSGLGLYLPAASYLNTADQFLAKMVVVVVIIVNGAFLNLFISPKLAQISFGSRHDHESGELRRLRKLAFALGGVSLVSWYSALILGSLRGLPFSFTTLVFFYLVLISVTIVGSQILERAYAHRARKSES